MQGRPFVGLAVICLPLDVRAVLHKITESGTVCYDSSVFVAAWQLPNNGLLFAVVGKESGFISDFILFRFSVAIANGS